MQITNKGIRTVLKDIESGHLILPALQREFVWKRRDIEKLFDSLLQLMMLFLLHNDGKIQKSAKLF